MVFPRMYPSQSINATGSSVSVALVLSLDASQPLKSDQDQMLPK